MELQSLLNSLFGGVLIGLAVTLMLLFNGRVTGISGIISSSLAKPSAEGVWRLYFLSGLVGGGLIVNLMRPDLLINLTEKNYAMTIGAGLLVGFGTVMGSGCTSGHGVCGISRLSMRSVLATLTFMFFGFLTVQLVRLMMGA